MTKRGIWVACPKCHSESHEFEERLVDAWLHDEVEFDCPDCGKEVLVS